MPLPLPHSATTRIALTIKHPPSTTSEDVEAALMVSFEKSEDYTLEGVVIIP